MLKTMDNSLLGFYNRLILNLHNEWEVKLMQHRLTREEQLKGAKKLLKSKKVQRNKKFHAALVKFIAKHS